MSNTRTLAQGRGTVGGKPARPVRLEGVPEGGNLIWEVKCGDLAGPGSYYIGSATGWGTIKTKGASFALINNKHGWPEPEVLDPTPEEAEEAWMVVVEDLEDKGTPDEAIDGWLAVGGWVATGVGKLERR